MRRKTHSEFMEQVKDRPFDVLGEYQGSKIKVRFRCNIDGHEWNAIPNHILEGHGCPECKARNYSERRKGCNKIISHIGGEVVIDVSTPAYPCGTSKMLESDFREISHHGRISIGSLGYCQLRVNGSTRLVHSIIIGALGPNVDIDHRNGDKTNNLRSNLRECTRSQNTMNARLAKNNTSGVTGVCWDNSKNKWMAQIAVGCKHIHLGGFNLKPDAIAARSAAEIKYFGEFRYQTRPKEERVANELEV